MDKYKLYLPPETKGFYCMSTMRFDAWRTIEASGRQVDRMLK